MFSCDFHSIHVREFNVQWRAFRFSTVVTKDRFVVEVIGTSHTAVNKLKYDDRPGEEDQRWASCLPFSLWCLPHGLAWPVGGVFLHLLDVNKYQGLCTHQSWWTFCSTSWCEHAPGTLYSPKPVSRGVTSLAMPPIPERYNHLSQRGILKAYPF